MPSSSNNSSFTVETDNQLFVRKLQKKFSVNDTILFNTCLNSFGIGDGIIPEDNYLNEYVSIFRENLYLVDKKNKINAGNKNLFLNILRILNPPITYRFFGSTNKYNFPAKVITQYTSSVVRHSMRKPCGDILKKAPNFGNSLLIKCINEKYYEEKTINFYKSIGKPIDKREINFVRVTHQLENNETKQRSRFLDHLISIIFEEIVCLLLNQYLVKVICSINSPKTGDILLENGNTVEVKCNIRNLSYIESSACLAGVYSGPVARNSIIDNKDCIVRMSYLTRTNIRSKFKTDTHNLILPTPMIKKLNEAIEDAVILSKVYIPINQKGKKMSLKFEELILGIDGEQEVANPYLSDNIFFPSSLDKLPIHSRRYQNNTAVPILPDFMSDNEENNSVRERFDYENQYGDNEVYGRKSPKTSKKKKMKKQSKKKKKKRSLKKK